MDKKKVEEVTEMMRGLVSDVQGAPYPGPNFEPALYEIWYEHAQRNAQNCFEFLNEYFPEDHKTFEKSLQKIFK